MSLARFVRRVLSSEESLGVERSEDIYVSFADLGRAKGIVYVCSKGHYHVIINDALSGEDKKRTYLHEIYHRFERLDCEREAEQFAEDILKRLRRKQCCGIA